MQREFTQRLSARQTELRTLCAALYPDGDGVFAQLSAVMEQRFAERSNALKALDRQRENHPDWFRGNGIVGMCLYADRFAGNLNGVRERLGYFEELHINYLHLMPFLDTEKGKSDGGYAVSDFRRVRPDLGTMDDLEALTAACREKGIAVCMDFVMNHTSEAHEWARRARAGEQAYQDYYFFYENREFPDRYDLHVPQVFPSTAPGNFTYLDDIGKYVMTQFYPYQWDLNYQNPAVLSTMTDNLLFLANKGIDVMRIDAVPYIWKELGTDCRNLPQVHTIVRLLHLVCEIVCPGVLLLGEVVMAPEKLAPYFGSPDAPECHMLYNATTMCTTWHTVATKDVRLLRCQTDIVSALPKKQVFLNYLRCHDDIGWGLDYPFLQQLGMEEVPHKAFLNAFFTGEYPGSFARGERYNDAPALGDARLCGTTASLLGVEAAESSDDCRALRQAVKRVFMLHAYLLSQSGIPMMYSGDEIGALNDYSYHDSPDTFDDSRYLHRGKFPWEQTALRNRSDTRQGRIYQGVKRLIQIRQTEEIFSSKAMVQTFDAGSDAVLGIKRYFNNRILTMVYNFSEEWQHIHLNAYGPHTDLVSRREIHLSGEWELPPYEFLWMLSRSIDESHLFKA